MSFGNQLLAQIDAANNDGLEIEAVCASPWTWDEFLHGAEKWGNSYLPGPDSIKTAYGHPARVLPGLPDGVWVLATKPRNWVGFDPASGLDITAVVARLRSGYLTVDEARRAFDVVKELTE